MNANGTAGLGVLLAALLAGCAGSDGAVVEVAPDDAAADVVADAEALDAGFDAGFADAADVVDAPDVPERCGNGVCLRGVEDCMTCPLDCNECPRCDMAPTCTGALAIPTASAALPTCNNTTASGDQRSNYACGTELGVSPGATTCADPLLRIRVREVSVQRGFFDVPRNMYCIISAEDGRHSELLLTPPREVAGNRNTTRFNLPLGQSVVWGQSDLYRSIANITVSYACYLTSNAGAAQRALMDIAGRAAMVSEHADGYGWVFGTVAVLGTIIGSSLSGISDTQILDVQQTISAGALLTMTNGRTWEIRSRRGNLDLSGASDLRLTMESWGCANVRTVVP
jgi:hypothetical protein